MKEKINNFLATLTREELIGLSQSWAGHEGVNYETTETEDLKSLCLDAMLPVRLW